MSGSPSSQNSTRQPHDCECPGHAKIYRDCELEANLSRRRGANTTAEGTLLCWRLFLSTKSNLLADWLEATVISNRAMRILRYGQTVFVVLEIVSAVRCIIRSSRTTSLDEQSSNRRMSQERSEWMSFLVESLRLFQSAIDHCPEMVCIRPDSAPVANDASRRGGSRTSPDYGFHWEVVQTFSAV